ncbi:hypothetical protein Tco_0062413 [Tanacetum coccineum]
MQEEKKKKEEVEKNNKAIDKMKKKKKLHLTKNLSCALAPGGLSMREVKKKEKQVKRKEELVKKRKRHFGLLCVFIPICPKYIPKNDKRNNQT